jgi:PhnB protein
MPSVKPIPEGHHTVTPHLIARDSARAIDFYKRAFGATELFRHALPDGKIMHAELRIGDSIVYLADEFPPYAQSPEALGGSPVVLHVYVEDVNALWDRAVAAGAKVVMPLGDQFWGDRYGQLTDPFGHRWSVATRKEELTPEEMEKRARAAMG